MKVIIAGGRNIRNIDVVYTALERCGIPEIDEIVSGMANGVDRLGEQAAQALGIFIQRFPADWDQDGKAAGFIRNKKMADYADALVAVWDGESRGTEHMIETMQKQGKPVYIHRVWMRIVETDNYDGDYPDESFVELPSMSIPDANQIVEVINNVLCQDGGGNRYWKVVPDCYELQPGFEP